MANNQSMTFDQYLAAYVLHRLRPSDLPGVAVRALLEGYDSPLLARVAGTSDDERLGLGLRETDEVFRDALAEIGKSLPDRRSAAWTLRQYYADLVVSGAIDPREGAEAVSEVAHEVEDVLPPREYVGDGLDVALLIGTYYSHDDFPPEDTSRHAAIDAALMKEFERIASEHARTPDRTQTESA